jgi:hypothetical protein
MELRSTGEQLGNSFKLNSYWATQTVIFNKKNQCKITGEANGYVKV